ncbi:hypothetical protein HDV05_006081 [Chytridiales sp. JEL 0842]|nr:hypothetical protein HDV05_006081 [Chytridiales sp. JEL 0842]
MPIDNSLVANAANLTVPEISAEVNGTSQGYAMYTQQSLPQKLGNAFGSKAAGIAAPGNTQPNTTMSSSPAGLNGGSTITAGATALLVVLGCAFVGLVIAGALLVRHRKRSANQSIEEGPQAKKQAMEGAGDTPVSSSPIINNNCHNIYINPHPTSLPHNPVIPGPTVVMTPPTPSSKKADKKAVQFSSGTPSGSEDDDESYVAPNGINPTSPLKSFVRRRSASISAAPGTSLNLMQRKKGDSLSASVSSSVNRLTHVGEIEEEDITARQTSARLTQAEDSTQLQQDSAASSVSSSLSSVSTVSSDGGAVARYEVLEPWLPQRFDEVALRPGDIVIVSKVYEDGWCDGKVEGTDEEGVFPMACLKGRAWSFFGMIEGGLQPKDVGIEEDAEADAEVEGLESNDAIPTVVDKGKGRAVEESVTLDIPEDSKIINMSSMESTENFDESQPGPSQV